MDRGSRVSLLDSSHVPVQTASEISPGSTAVSQSSASLQDGMQQDALMWRREGGTSRLDHVQLMWGSSKLRAPIAATRWANRCSCSLSRDRSGVLAYAWSGAGPETVASLHTHGQELAQSH